MTDLKPETLDLLKKFDLTPKKYLSQNFVVNSSLNKLHVKNLDLTRNDEIIEIGGGLGFLTKEIAARVHKVTTIEIDKNLAMFLKERLQEHSNIEIIQGDILKIDSKIFKKKKIVSNTPYSISSPLLFKIIQTSNYISSSLCFQKEFAERLIAKPNTKKYGKISLTSRIYSEIELIKYIPKEFFFPIPKVNSALVKIIPRNNIDFNDLDFLHDFIKEIFNYRNKTLRNGVKLFLKKGNINLNVNDLTAPILERKIISLSLEEIITFLRNFKLKL